MNFFKKIRLISTFVLVSTTVFTPSMLPAMKLAQIVMETPPDRLVQIGTGVAIAAAATCKESVKDLTTKLGDTKAAKAALEERKRSAEAQRNAELIIGHSTPIQGIPFTTTVTKSKVGDPEAILIVNPPVPAPIIAVPSQTKTQAAQHSGTPIPATKQPPVASTVTTPSSDQNGQAATAAHVPLVPIVTQEVRWPTQDAQPYQPQISPNCFVNVTTNTLCSHGTPNQINKQNMDIVKSYGHWSVEQCKTFIHSVNKETAYAQYSLYGLPNFIQALKETYPDHKQTMLALNQALKRNDNAVIAYQTVFTLNTRKNKVKGTGKTLKKVVAKLAAAAPAQVITPATITPIIPKTRPQTTDGQTSSAADSATIAALSSGALTTPAAPPPVEPPPGKDPKDNKDEKNAQKAPTTQQTKKLPPEQSSQNANRRAQAKKCVEEAWDDHINKPKHRIMDLGKSVEEVQQKIVDIIDKFDMEYGLKKGPNQIRLRVDGKTYEVKPYLDENGNIKNVNAFQGESTAKPDKVNFRDVGENFLDMQASTSQAGKAAAAIIGAISNASPNMPLGKKLLLNAIHRFLAANPIPTTQQEKNDANAQANNHIALTQPLDSHLNGSPTPTSPSLTPEQENKHAEDQTPFISALKQVLNIPANDSSSQPTPSATTETTQQTTQQEYVTQMKSLAQQYTRLRDRGFSLNDPDLDPKTQTTFKAIDPLLQAIAKRQKADTSPAKDIATTMSQSTNSNGNGATIPATTNTIPPVATKTGTVQTQTEATPATINLVITATSKTEAPATPVHQTQAPQPAAALTVVDTATTTPAATHQPTSNTSNTQAAQESKAETTTNNNKQPSIQINVPIPTATPLDNMHRPISTASLPLPSHTPSQPMQNVHVITQYLSQMQTNGFGVKDMNPQERVAYNSLAEALRTYSNNQQSNQSDMNRLREAAALARPNSHVVDDISSIIGATGIFHSSYANIDYAFCYDDGLLINYNGGWCDMLSALNTIDITSKASTGDYICSPLVANTRYYNQEQMFDDLMNRLRQLSKESQCPYRKLDALELIHLKNLETKLPNLETASILSPEIKAKPSRLKLATLSYATQLCRLETTRIENATAALKCFDRNDQSWWKSISRKIIPDVATVRTYIENCLNAYYQESAVVKLYTAMKGTLLGNQPTYQTYPAPELPPSCRDFQTALGRYNGTPLQHYVHKIIVHSATEVSQYLRDLNTEHTPFESHLIAENICAFHLYILMCVMELNQANYSLEALDMLDFCSSPTHGTTSVMKRLSAKYLTQLDGSNPWLILAVPGIKIFEAVTNVGSWFGWCKPDDNYTQLFDIITQNIASLLENKDSYDNLTQCHRNLSTQFANALEYTNLDLKTFDNLVLNQAQQHINALQKREAQATQNAAVFLNTLIFANEQKQATTQTTRQHQLPQILLHALTNEARNEQRAAGMNYGQQELELWGPVRRILKDVLTQILQNAQTRRTQYETLLRAALQQQAAITNQTAPQAPTGTKTAAQPASAPATTATIESPSTTAVALTCAPATANATTTQKANPSNVNETKKPDVPNTSRDTIVAQLDSLLTESHRILTEEPAELAALLNTTPQSVNNPTKQALTNLLEQSRALRANLTEIDTNLNQVLKETPNTANAT